MNYLKETLQVLAGFLVDLCFCLFFVFFSFFNTLLYRHFEMYLDSSHQTLDRSKMILFALGLGLGSPTLPRLVGWVVQK